MMMTMMMRGMERVGSSILTPNKLRLVWRKDLYISSARCHAQIFMFMLLHVHAAFCLHVSYSTVLDIVTTADRYIAKTITNLWDKNNS